ncbi:MAG: LytTR family DNA-binding domain-containing protein [Lachnospiraceae bacterium]|nr:LytTR family DNA-binding domain-containing protein [Lachnospiraceae bacterium]
MRIAICDDEMECLDLLETLILDFSKKRNLKVEIEQFVSGQFLLFANAASKYDIVFLDIYLEDENGMDVAKRLNLSREQQLIFTTTSEEYAIEAFGLNATHYLVKPITNDSVTQAMERCLKRAGKSTMKMLDIKTSDGRLAIPMENVQYIEVFNKKCEIHTAHSIYQTYISLDALFEQLDAGLFFKAQRSYIVNMREIDSFFFDHLVLKNGLEITLSRSNRSVLKKQYQNYLFDLARRDTF